MAQFAIFLFSALVVLNSFHLHTTAAPLDIKLATSDFQTVWWAPEPISAAAEPSASAAVPLEPESTITHWETATVIEQPTVTTTPDDGLGSQAWVLPEDFTDLSPFGIQRIAYGSPNIAVVTGIPASASATPGSPTSIPAPSVASAAAIFTSPELPRPWTNDSATYRLFFPSGSINPGNKPQGGSDFYATPLSLQTANNVTLEYSIFFPADFEWVHGGKLPGLYGGHGGCSGGNNAKSCFSTRMMWRQGGAGELYLYAPKDKQTAELCQAPPQSVCDATYGLSVGRGAFHFVAGDWTHVSQTVRLNTPGKQDGGFELVVNGQRIMRRDDVFYRDVLSSPQPDNGGSGDSGSDDGGDSAGGGTSDGGDSGSAGGGDTVGGGNGDGGDSLGLGGLLGGLLRRDLQFSEEVDYDVFPTLLAPSEAADVLGEGVYAQAPLFAPEAVSPPTPKATMPAKDINGGPKIPPLNGAEIITLTTTVTLTQLAQAPAGTAPAGLTKVQMESKEDKQNAIGFSGIFFSTFFGGHEQSWASPKDQYTYFKDFGMTVNA